MTEIGIYGVTSLIRERWQPVCLAGNLRSIKYKRALTSALGVLQNLELHVIKKMKI